MGISGKLSRFFLRSQLTPLLAVIAFLLGLFALAVTPREEEPQIDVTMANVMIPFMGAKASDVERLVSVPAEQVLSPTSAQRSEPPPTITRSTRARVSTRRLRRFSAGRR